MNILVLGRDGQLGQSLHDRLPSAYPSSVFWDRQTLDLEQLDDIEPRLTAARPEVIINATAYTAVDQAETNTDLAFTINHHAVGRVADYCAKNDVPLLHVSTDYVFDGSSQRPYAETDEPNPRGVYGASKLAGERAIAASGCRHVILRTAWVFSEHGQNFLKTMLRLGGERDTLSVVGDQIGCPTYAGDLALGLISVLKSVENGACEWGLYHYAGDPNVSWFEFAEAIFAKAASAGLAVPDHVTAITTKEYPTPAPRPAWSVLDSARFTKAFGEPASNWRTGIDTCLRALNQPSQ